MINKLNRRAVVIAVWGNSGSGKSVFSAILARWLTRDQKHALIINPDQSTPMLSVLTPMEQTEQRMSLGTVLNSEIINTGITASKVKIVSSHKYIGILGYAPGDTPYTYPSYSYEKAVKLIDCACELVDYVIIDCTSRFLDVFTPAAIESADISISLLTPDLYGISYYKSNAPLLQHQRFHQCDEFTIFGCTRPYMGEDEMQHFLGKCDGTFPWTKLLSKASVEGKIFEAGTYCNAKHMAVLKMIGVAAKRAKAGKGVNIDGEQTRPGSAEEVKKPIELPTAKQPVEVKPSVDETAAGTGEGRSAGDAGTDDVKENGFDFGSGFTAR